MTRARSDIEKAMDLFERMISGDDPAAMMREAEVAKGYTIVPRGSVPWFPKDEWGARDVVSTDGHEVRLVAIGAKRPRTGSLKRMLAGILSAGLRPVIICPLFDMTLIMHRWGWRCRYVGVEFDEREEQWRPPGWHWEPRTEATAAPGPEPRPEAASAAVGPASRQGGPNR